MLSTLLKFNVSPSQVVMSTTPMRTLAKRFKDDLVVIVAEKGEEEGKENKKEK